MNDQARKILLRLIRDYGISLAHNPQRLNALFKDYAKGQFKREIFLCVQAAREGIALELLNNQHLPLDALATRLAIQLQNDYGLDKLAASWAVETWIIALGFQLPTTTNLMPIVQQTPPIATTANHSVQMNRPVPSYPAHFIDDDLTLFVEDGISWVKNLLSWQKNYTDNGDGTVSDSRTGLQWMRFVLGQYWNGRAAEGRAIECNLHDALAAVKQLNNNKRINCGYTDWRIPTWEELNTIRGSSSEVIDTKVFPNTPDGRFWTISESSSSNDLTQSTEKRFYTVNFNRFNAHYAFGTSLAHNRKYTRLVR